jgi:hypothetical protein
MLKKHLDKFAATIKKIELIRKAKREASKNQEEVNQILKNLRDGGSN